jgi:hypothetical protein
MLPVHNVMPGSRNGSVNALPIFFLLATGWDSVPAQDRHVVPGFVVPAGDNPLGVRERYI